MNRLICNDCQKTYDVSLTLWKCHCGGLLNIKKQIPKITKDSWDDYPNSIWRYFTTMPFPKDSQTWRSITMGEGQTPFIKLNPAEENTYVKVDYMMPTLSFKDRGAAVLLTVAKQLGAAKVIADSSGNAGTAIAAYATRCNIDCDIYLSQETSPKKIAQIKAHGATIKKIAGNREDVANAAQQAVEKENVFYASHVYNPYFYEGTKTYAYEIYEQLKGAPDTLIIPVGNGTLLLGAYYGFKELYENNLVHKIPKLVAIQTDNCAPLAYEFHHKKHSSNQFVPKQTIAEGIAISSPARAKQILAAVQQTKGTFITIKEDEIMNACSLLSNQGFHVELTTGVNYAGYLKYSKIESEKIVVPLCGAGLKSD